MDNAVALVQAYLRVNGYFTVTEYPVMEITRHGEVRTATDIDVLAVRFPGAGTQVTEGRRHSSTFMPEFSPDTVLGVPAGQADMLIGEVKEGRATLNGPATDPDVLRAVLVRFGCCDPSAAPQLVEGLVRHGKAQLPAGHHARLVAFGSTIDEPSGRAFHRIALGQVVRFLHSFIRAHWAELRHAEHKDLAFGFLVALEKAERGLR